MDVRQPQQHLIRASVNPLSRDSRSFRAQLTHRPHACHPIEAFFSPHCVITRSRAKKKRPRKNWRAIFLKLARTSHAASSSHANTEEHAATKSSWQEPHTVAARRPRIKIPPIHQHSAPTTAPAHCANWKGTLRRAPLLLNAHSNKERRVRDKWSTPSPFPKIRDGAVNSCVTTDSNGCHPHKKRRISKIFVAESVRT